MAHSKEQDKNPETVSEDQTLDIKNKDLNFKMIFNMLKVIKENTEKELSGTQRRNN